MSSKVYAAHSHKEFQVDGPARAKHRRLSSRQRGIQSISADWRTV